MMNDDLICERLYKTDHDQCHNYRELTPPRPSSINTFTHFEEQPRLELFFCVHIFQLLLQTIL